MMLTIECRIRAEPDCLDRSVLFRKFVHNVASTNIPNSRYQSNNKSCIEIFAKPHHHLFKIHTVRWIHLIITPFYTWCINNSTHFISSAFRLFAFTARLCPESLFTLFHEYIPFYSRCGLSRIQYLCCVFPSIRSPFGKLHLRCSFILIAYNLGNTPRY